jgi:hypothetical protein
VNTKHLGPFAFPHEFKFDDGSSEFAYGMTLRDYFAAKAMVGFLSGRHHEDTICSSAGSASVSYYDAVAQVAYAQAEAMLKARSE